MCSPTGLYICTFSSSMRPRSLSISYDRTDLSPTSVTYEVGPDKSRSGGGLGNIAFFGTSRGGGTVDLEGPLYAEMPNLAREAMNLLKGWDR